MTIPPPSPVRYIQSLSGNFDSWSFFAHGKAHTSSWRETSYQSQRAGNDITYSQIKESKAAGNDLYFSPLAFSERQRKNAHVFRPRVLFADLDPVDPRDLTIRPTIAWETSPGMFQAVWVLDKALDSYSVWCGLNKRLTVSTGADPGGWFGSKLLRVPGTFNYKRGAWGKLLWWDKTRFFSPTELNDTLPVLSSHTREVHDDFPAPMDSKEWEWLLGLHWPKLSLLAKSLIVKQRVPDRSRHLIKTANALITTLKPHEAFQLLWLCPTNKYRLDRYAPELLWFIVRRAQKDA